MPRQTARPPFAASLRQTVVLAACVLAWSLVFAAGARAQDDDDDDYDAPAPVVIDINGPCQLTVNGQSIPCRGVTYMVFPSDHRMDFAAVTGTVDWAFSGGADENRGGRYALAVDSVLNATSGRLDAGGRCEMRVAEDRRTVTSLDCKARTPGGEFTLKASGTIEVEDTGDDDQDDGPDDDADLTVA